MSRPSISWLWLMLLVGVAWVAPAGTISFAGDRTEVTLSEGRERTVLEGTARVVSDSITIEADRIELSGENLRYADTTGNVRVTDAERSLVITAGELSFDQETENLHARGDVVIEDQSNEILLRGGYVETQQGGDILVVQIGVRVFRDDMTARAQALRYRREEDLLELSGFPIVVWDGDEYQADRITMNLATDEIELEGRVQGEIIVEDEGGDDE